MSHLMWKNYEYWLVLILSIHSLGRIESFKYALARCFVEILQCIIEWSDSKQTVRNTCAVLQKGGEGTQTGRNADRDNVSFPRTSKIMGAFSSTCALICLDCVSQMFGWILYQKLWSQIPYGKIKSQCWH